MTLPTCIAFCKTVVRRAQRTLYTSIWFTLFHSPNLILHPPSPPPASTRPRFCFRRPIPRPDLVLTRNLNIAGLCPTRRATTTLPFYPSRPLPSLSASISLPPHVPTYASPTASISWTRPTSAVVHLSFPIHNKHTPSHRKAVVLTFVLCFPSTVHRSQQQRPRDTATDRSRDARVHVHRPPLAHLPSPLPVPGRASGPSRRREVHFDTRGTRKTFSQQHTHLPSHSTVNTVRDLSHSRRRPLLSAFPPLLHV